MFCQQVGDFPVVVNNHNVWLLRSHTELGMDRTTPWHRKGKEHHFKFVMCDSSGTELLPVSSYKHYTHLAILDV